MRVHVAFTPAEEVSAPLGIVVDVLRATSTIVQALARGYGRVLCCQEIEEARALAAGQPDARLAGERKTVRIDGFDYGNSPAEIAASEPAETLVLTTTNGTRLLLAAAARCERVLVGSLLNLSAVAAAVRGADEVVIMCAGVRGEMAIDDAYCAGRIAEAIGGDHHDSAAAAVRLARSFESAFEGLSASQSARDLHGSGLDSDIADCARESVLDVVPRYVRMVGVAAEVGGR
ncbi:MAG TPA: 2-phosphosulfolactate phosphatase [Gaiellaceae bacterium]|nr:2-phosphosulfolactate phosphatase [Gaiellaceae bacterium]